MNDLILNIIEAIGYLILSIAVFILGYIVHGISKFQDFLLLALGLTFLFIAIVEIIEMTNGDKE